MNFGLLTLFDYYPKIAPPRVHLSSSEITYAEESASIRSG
jgi:hypothetical protein